jgi:hypothetical protein
MCHLICPSAGAQTGGDQAAGQTGIPSLAATTRALHPARRTAVAIE